MATHISLRKTPTLVLALASLCAVAQADSFTTIVVYGDSLSDNGNLFAASGGTFPLPPNFEGRRSNGPVAVEYLADALGAPLADLAWLGATTGIGNSGDGGSPTTVGALGLRGMLVELATTPAALLAPGAIGNELFVVWGGADDILAPSPLDSTPQDVISRGVADVLGIVSKLQALGAQNILVPGVPDLGLTPFFEGVGPAAAAAATGYTDAFNAQLVAGLPTGVVYYDTAGLLRSIVADPAAYGLTNVTTPCFDGVASVCANPDQYLFWDDFHPTTAGHAIVADAFDRAVPEPSSMVLLLTACALGIAARKRRR